MINNKVANFFSFILIMSCTNQSIVRSDPEMDKKNEKPQPKMVYLFFEGEKTADGKEIITPIDKKYLMAFLKMKNLEQQKTSPIHFIK
jgi:hypothetical protein